MKSRLALALAAALGLSGPLAAAEPAAAQPAAPASTAPMSANPFFAPSTLPYKLPPFDKIKNEHFAPGFDQGMKEQLAEIDAIANNAEKPTFENTIVALDKSGQTLIRVSNVFFNLTSANTNETMEKIQAEYAPKLAAHNDAIVLNGKLFQRVKALYDQRASLGLDPESLRLLERYHTDFVRAGANLSDADKDKLKAINGELASLSTKFSQNVLKETNAEALVVDDVKQLEGMPENEIAAAKEAAKARGLPEGKYVI